MGPHAKPQRGKERKGKKYDYRYSVLVFVFARLVGEGWITKAELKGLSEDKLAKIRLVMEIGGR